MWSPLPWHCCNVCNVFKWVLRGQQDNYENWCERFDVIRAVKCVHLSLGIAVFIWTSKHLFRLNWEFWVLIFFHLSLSIAVHFLLLLQLDSGIEEVLNSYVIGTLLKKFMCLNICAYMWIYANICSIEEVLDCHVVGTLLRNFGCFGEIDGKLKRSLFVTSYALPRKVLTLVATWRRALKKVKVWAPSKSKWLI